MTVSHTPGEWTTKVRKRVRSVLAEREISAAKVAGLAGWNQQYLARRLTAKSPVPFSVADLETIASVLGISPVEFTGDRKQVAA